MNKSNSNNQKTNSLFKAILALKTSGEAGEFLRDLWTIDEIKEFSNRWQAAQMLNQGISYNQITRQTRLSSTTIARISKCLNRKNSGYKIILKRLGLHHHNSSPSGKGLG